MSVEWSLQWNLEAITNISINAAKGAHKPANVPSFMHQDLVAFLVSSDVSNSSLLNNNFMFFTLFFSFQTAAPFLKVLLYLITVKDTTACTKISNLCFKITPILAQLPDLREFLARDVLVKALEVRTAFVW